MARILIVTGDAGESYEALYAVHRFREEDWHVAVAAPSARRLHLVMHDFEPGWDTMWSGRATVGRPTSRSTR